MSKRLRILHLEDDSDYCELVRSYLETEGLDAEIVTVSTRERFEAALGNETFDLILADYLLPSWNGLLALKAAREQAPSVPFLLISGTIREQTAIQSLNEGATDYVLKHCLERLVPAIRRAVDEASERRERQKAEAELQRRERYFRTLTENALDVLITLDESFTLLYASPSVERVLGYNPQELIGFAAMSLVHPNDVETIKNHFSFGLANPGVMVRTEVRIRHADGSWRYLEAIGQSRLDDPDARAVVVTLRDISERKVAEESLKESEQQYRLIFDDNPIPMWVFDRDTLQFVEVNDAALQHYGYSRQEFLAMHLKDIQETDGGPAMVEYLHNLLPAAPAVGKMGLAGTWKHCKKDGSIIDVELKWSAISFKGRPASLTMAIDITQRIHNARRDASLSNLGHRLSSATSPSEAAHIIMAVADELFRWDRFSLALYAGDRDTVLPLLSLDTDSKGVRFEVPGQSKASPPDELTRMTIAEGAQLVLRDPAEPIPDGANASASLLMVPLRNRTNVIGLLGIQSYTSRAYTNQDLCALQTLADHCGGALERIRAELALHESEQRFRELFEGSPDAIFVEDVSGIVLDTNPAGCRLHKLTREQIVGRPVSELMPPEVRESAMRRFTELASGKLQQVEGWSWTSEQVAVPVEVRASRVEYAGKPAVLLHVRDITSRREVETALRNSETLFHSVWENSVDGMRLTDEEGRIVAVNEAFCALFGMAREELEGEQFTATYAQTENASAILDAYKADFKARVVRSRLERKLILRNRSEVIFEETLSFVEVKGEPPLQLSLFREIGFRKKLEEQLRQAQKMEAIGQLAGGVAHDFNNILTVIHGHASLLQSSCQAETGSAKSAEQISQAAERAAGLTRQLLTFSRRQVMQLRLLDMNEVVGNLTNMLGRLLGEDVALQLHYSPKQAVVNADSGMLEQVLLNLAVNSRDAMPSGGVLSIRVSSRDYSAEDLAEDIEVTPGTYVCLSVTDTGQGIPSENLRRIFDPFFTTKEVGKGTGLGLSTVYGIVKQHHGWIHVESSVGRGTTFHVGLPATQAALPKPATEAEIQVCGGKETILVVEDEGPLRELVCQVLERHGYQIFQARSGAEALNLWQEKGDGIDLLLTDLVMPDRVNGRELAQRLLADRPELKVIFTSGYSADIVGKDFVLQVGLNYLQKPYHPLKLASAVRRCLDAVN